MIIFNFILFELKKFWRKRHFLWMLLIILFCVGGTFIQNYMEKSTLKDRAEQQMKPYFEETDKIYQNLRGRESDNAIDEVYTRQLEEIIEMGKALYNWKLAITSKDWDKIPTYEHDFLVSLLQFSKYGGDFQSLQGTERSRAIAKNEWMIKHDLSYVDEEYPLAPILFLKVNTKLLFGVTGVVVLLFLFGNIITDEKEQNTWLFLKTQPIPRWKLLIGKFICILVIVSIFIMLVIILGIGVSWVFGNQMMNFQYPQLVGSGETFTIISTTYYIKRELILFLNTSLVTFGIVFLISRWARNSFTVFITTCFILTAGITLTEMNKSIQVGWNPFQSFQFNKILNESPNNTGWILLFFAIVWSLSILLPSIFLPESESELLNNSSYLTPFHRGKTKINANPLLILMLFEIRKIRRRGLFKQVNFLLSILVILGYFFLSEKTAEKKKEYFQELKKSADIIESVVYPDMKQQIAILEREPNDSTYKEQLADLKKGEAVILEILNKNKAAVNGYKNGKWYPFYEYQFFQMRFANKEIDSGNLQNAFKETLGQFTIDVSIAEKKWLMEHDIQPVFSGDFVPTIFTNNSALEKDGSNKWLEMNQKLDNSGLYTLYVFFKDYFYLVPICLFILLFGSGFAIERGKKNTLYFLKTQPIDAKQIFIGKILNSTIFSLLNSIGLVLFVLIIGMLFNRFGDWEYPILFYDHHKIAISSNYTGNISYGGNGFHFIPLGVNIVQSLVLLICLLLFTIALSHLISLLFKNSLAVFSTTTLTLLIGYIVSTKVIINFAYLSPFTYFNIAKITNGELSILLDQSSISIEIGCMILFLSTIILVISGYILISRKNKVSY
ncbi:ABC transporter permease [Gottfriedia acidiceleris]|uniref:ABC transporter permease n=1 Tax=Gottfriedia acidiceleris TaxID=371036 RepID=UPI002FFD5B20